VERRRQGTFTGLGAGSGFSQKALSRRESVDTKWFLNAVGT